MISALKNIEKYYTVVLASHSPRRKMLFKLLDLPFVTDELTGFVEVYPDDLPRDEVPLFLAKRKGEEYFAKHWCEYRDEANSFLNKSREHSEFGANDFKDVVNSFEGIAAEQLVGSERNDAKAAQYAVIGQCDPDMDYSLSDLSSYPSLESRKKILLVITADTVVLLSDRLLGKPCDKDEARRMLQVLSGKTHKVITGVCITTSKFQNSFSVTTDVTFGQLSSWEIDYYLEHYNPLDKAGAYGIQDWIGAVGVRHISGSFYNVMGLPVYQLYKELEKISKLQC